jgi:hypothetical protein
MSKVSGYDKNKSTQSLLTWNIENKKANKSTASMNTTVGSPNSTNSTLPANGNGITTSGIQSITSAEGVNRYDIGGQNIPAGKLHNNAEYNGFTNKLTKWSDYKMREMGSGQAPYGTTTTTATTATTTTAATPIVSSATSATSAKGSSGGGGGRVKSLADMLKGL